MSAEEFKGVGQVLLEVEINSSQKNSFEKRYFDATGEIPADNEHYQTQENKWGTECRIYFNGDAVTISRLTDLGFHVENRTTGYRSDLTSRINSSDLFWELVENGYRIGFNN